MAVAHVSAGLILSQKIKSGKWIFLSCLALHFVCDAMPHWNPSLLAQPSLAVLDLLSAGLVLGIWGNLDRRTFWTVLGSTLPDVVFVCEWLFFGGVVSSFTVFHGEIQTLKLDPSSGILVQILFLGLLYRCCFPEKFYREELGVKRV